MQAIQTDAVTGEAVPLYEGTYDLINMTHAINQHPFMVTSIYRAALTPSAPVFANTNINTMTTVTL